MSTTVISLTEKAKKQIAEGFAGDVDRVYTRTLETMTLFEELKDFVLELSNDNSPVSDKHADLIRRIVRYDIQRSVTSDKHKSRIKDNVEGYRANGLI